MLYDNNYYGFKWQLMRRPFFPLLHRTKPFKQTQLDIQIVKPDESHLPCFNMHFCFEFNSDNAE